MANLIGTSGADVLNGVDPGGVPYGIVEGREGDDTITAAPGSQAIVGGQGNDLIIGSGTTGLAYWDAPTGVIVDLAAGTAEDGYGTIDRFSGVSIVHLTRFNDAVLGSSAHEIVIAGGGGGVDRIDLGGGGDQVRIIVAGIGDVVSIARDASALWTVHYRTTKGASAELQLRNVESLVAWDPNFATIGQWQLLGTTAERVDNLTSYSPRTIITSVIEPSRFWTVDPNPVYRVIDTEQHQGAFYPTAATWNPPGGFITRLQGDAQVGDFNGDGRQDIVLGMHMFPHTIAHSLIKPVLLANHSGNLVVEPAFAQAITVGRHMFYRNEAADYNGDGATDYIVGAMGILERLASGQYRNVWEPNLAVLSNGAGGWVDATTQVAGMESYSVPADWGFAHDFAAGDFDGDGDTDFFAGKRLFENDGNGNFGAAQDKLPTAAGPVMASGFVMSSLLADVDRDGKDDLLFWMNDPLVDQGFAFLTAGGALRDAAVTKLPVGAYGAGPTKFNFAIEGDLNHDGWVDVITGQTRSEPYYVGRAVQILINRQGTLVDETFARSGTDPRYGSPTPPTVASGFGGEGETYLADVNGDGHIDIVDHGATSVKGDPVIRVLLNDGEGYFTDLDLSRIPYAQPWQMSGNLDKQEWMSAPIGTLLPIDLDGQYGIDWVGQVELLNSGQPRVEYAYVILSTARYGKAHEGDEGAIHAAPGFDAEYYLRGHADAASAVASGAHASGLAHYLAVGKALGYAAFAPYTWVHGHAAADVIALREGNERAFGYGGDDRFFGGAGDDTIDGGSGSDLATFSGSLASYRLAREGSTHAVRDLSDTDGNDTLVSIERLQFSDFRVNLSVQGAAASVSVASLQRLEELYVAFFNRTPGADGLEYWIGQFKSGITIDQIADAFYNAGVQFSSLTGYRSDMSHADFVNNVYRNVLGRPEGAAADGLAYWTTELASGRESRGSLVSSILDSAHTFKGNATWGWVADLLDNKVVVANRFSVEWGLNYNSSQEAITKGMAIAAAVTPTDTDAAIALIGVNPLHIQIDTI